MKKSMAVTAGAFCIPSIIPASAMGRNGFVAPSDRLTMALIGSGGQGRGDMKQFLRNKEVQVVACCDVHRDQTEKAAAIVNEAYGNEDIRMYEDYRVLLEKEELDTALLALPDHWHSIISVSVANKGIDIYGEKPLARSIPEGRAIVNAVQKNNIIWQTGSWQRSVDHFYRACLLVRNGRLGKITHVDIGLPDGNKSIGSPPVKEIPEGLNWDMWLGPAPYVPFRGVLHWDWRWIMDYSGGQMTDWAGHHIDIANWGLDFDETAPVEIEGKGVYPAEGIFNVPFEYDVKLKYENGLTMRIANASAYPGRQGTFGDTEGRRNGMGAMWFGENGWIHVSRRGLWASKPELLEDIEPEIDIYHSPDHYRTFIDCVKSRKETNTPARYAHNSISVALLGEIAMLTGEKLKWDASEEKFIENDNANRLLIRPMRAPWEIPAI